MIVAARKQAGAEAADGGRGQGSGGLDPNRCTSREDLGDHPGLRGPTQGSPGSSAPDISRGSRDRPQRLPPLSCPFWCPAPGMSFTSRPQTSDHAEAHGSGQSPPAECRRSRILTGSFLRPCRTSDDSVDGSTSLRLCHARLWKFCATEKVGQKGRGAQGRGCFLTLEPGKKFHAFIVIRLNAQAPSASARDTCAGFRVQRARPRQYLLEFSFPSCLLPLGLEAAGAPSPPKTPH